MMDEVEKLPLIIRSDEEIEHEEYILKIKQKPKIVANNVKSLRLWLFPKTEIFFFFEKPKVDVLKKLKFSKNHISEYINHKNYKMKGVSGRCKHFNDINKVIVSVNDFDLNDPRKVSTFYHETIHLSHRLYESENINFTEEGLCTLVGLIGDLILSNDENPLEDYDLSWCKYLIKRKND